MLLRHGLATLAAPPHPLAGTAAQWLWLLPLLPLLGFVINGALSLLSAARLGPSDPSATHNGGHGAGPDHGAGTESAGGAHGDDHHTDARHRYAAVTSFVGPAVLVLSFLLAAWIFSRRDLPAPL